jgi:AcrR family transcriptional regulator
VGAAAAGDETRARLILAATRLMAQHGIEGVNLKQIHRAAETRNRSAIAYHFGDRDGLVQAIGAEHRAVIDRDRSRMLDRLERNGQVSIPTLADALVLPLAKRLADPDGRAYIIVLAEAATRMGTQALTNPDRPHIDGVMRVRDHLHALLTGPHPNRRRRIGRVILITPVLLADIARDLNRDHLTLTASRRRVAEVTSLISRALS